MRKSSLKDLAVASALVLGFLPSEETTTVSYDWLFFSLGAILAVLWLCLKLSDLFDDEQ